jgi:hypothetical protein
MAVLGLVHRKYIETGQLDYTQPYGMAVCAWLTANMAETPEIPLLTECSQYTMCCLMAVNRAGTDSYG